MTFDDFVFTFETNVWPARSQVERYGQALMNYLYEVWPAEAERIIQSQCQTLFNSELKHVDCFYNDNLVANTLIHLQSVWNQFPD